jgi:hypothetical protein
MPVVVIPGDTFDICRGRLLDVGQELSRETVRSAI